MYRNDHIRTTDWVDPRIPDDEPWDVDFGWSWGGQRFGLWGTPAGPQESCLRAGPQDAPDRSLANWLSSSMEMHSHCDWLAHCIAAAASKGSAPAPPPQIPDMAPHKQLR